MKLLKTISIILCIFTSYSVLAEEEGIDLAKEYTSISDDINVPEVKFYKRITTTEVKTYDTKSIFSYLDKKALLELCNKVGFFHSTEEYDEYNKKFINTFGYAAVNYGYTPVLDYRYFKQDINCPEDGSLTRYYKNNVEKAFNEYKSLEAKVTYKFLGQNYGNQDFQSKFKKTKEKLWKSCDLNLKDIDTVSKLELEVTIDLLNNL